MILILTGPVHARKTTFLKNLLPVLKAREIRVSGYLSLRVLERGRTSGYDLFDIKAGKSMPFLRRNGRTGWQRIGPYFFLPSGLRAAEDRILGCRVGEWLVVDEVGPQELTGGGVWPALSAVLRRQEFHGLLVVRRSLLDKLLSCLGKRPIEVFDIATENLLPAVMEKLARPEAGAVTKIAARKGRAES